MQPAITLPVAAFLTRRNYNIFTPLLTQCGLTWKINIPAVPKVKNRPILGAAVLFGLQIRFGH
jgi:hypothetical protein